MAEILPFGTLLPDSNPAQLSSDHTRRALAACKAHKAFKVIDLRTWQSPEGDSFDVIVVDCINDQVPTHNKAGILVRERVALLFPGDTGKPPEVRALRADFPAVAHLNHVPAGQPASLCLYADPWERVRRTWTPQKHLQQVLGWLAGTAQGTLHRRDQPLEQIYFASPIELILPPDFDERVGKDASTLTLSGIERTNDRATYRSQFGGQTSADVVPIVLTLDPIVHGAVERHPRTLGDLEVQLEKRSKSIIEPLRNAIRGKIPSTGVYAPAKQACLLVLDLPVQREPGGAIERHEHRGFFIFKPLALVGEAVGVLHRQKDRYFAVALLGDGPPKNQADGWRDIPLHLVDVKTAVTRLFARVASGCPEAGANDARVLAGVGALGSALAELWSREGWGKWTFMDLDHVKPHNVVRHIARDDQVGFNKADVVKALTDAIYQEREGSEVFRESVLNPGADKALREAALVVDATTTLEVPRELALREGARSVTIFLTPQGSDSVLLLEDAERKVRLDALEAQYYFGLLQNDWGTAHLEGRAETLGVGAGCRDVSFIMSAEIIQLHAAILARQVRELSADKSPRIRVWRAAPDGSVTLFAAPALPPTIVSSEKWRIVSHSGVEQKLMHLRQDQLPSETGGVILGYIDHQSSSIFVVDVLSAPPDSAGDAGGFVRGTKGLAEAVADAQKRTAGIVGYIGEWHSHPPFHSARPSGDDRLLIDHLANVLARDGEPALMIIVGSAGELSYSIRESAG